MNREIPELPEPSSPTFHQIPLWIQAETARGRWKPRYRVTSRAFEGIVT